MQRRVSLLVSLITGSKRSVAITATVTLVILAPLKFSLVRSLLSMGVPKEALQAQDAILSGTLSAALVWILLMAVRVRRRQDEEQLRAVADLNHNVRNALQIIFASNYLRQSDRSKAILESVERIDTALRALMPQGKLAATSRELIDT